MKKDDLKEEIQAIKLDKQKLEKEIALIEQKIQIQDAVNDLFESKVIDGDDVVEKPVLREKVTMDDISKIKLDGLRENNEWTRAMKGLIGDAKDQYNDIVSAKRAVDELFDGEKVKQNVTRAQYNNVKKMVDAIRNEKIRAGLGVRLEKVLDVVKAREEKERAAEATQGAASNGGAGSKSQAVQSKSGSKSSKSYSSSKSGSKFSGSSKSYSGSSGGSNTTASKSGSNNLSKPIRAKNVKVTGSGKIKNYGGYGEEGSRYWIGGTFEIDIDE